MQTLPVGVEGIFTIRRWCCTRFKLAELLPHARLPPPAQDPKNASRLLISDAWSVIWEINLATQKPQLVVWAGQQGRQVGKCLLQAAQHWRVQLDVYAG
jgi:hypothetical protein